MAQEPDLQEIVQRIEQIEKKLGIFTSPGDAEKLEPLIEKIESRTLQQILREIDAKDLVYAMMEFKQPALRKILDAMSHKSREMIKDDMAYWLKRGIYGNVLWESRLKLMGIIRQLEQMGEIVIPRGEEEPFSKKGYLDLKERWEKEEEKRKAKQQVLETWKKEVFDKLD